MNEDEQILQIIQALKYAVGDIQHNKERTLSAFILCVCCVDALGALRFFKGKSCKRWEDFVCIYMKDYKELGIYEKCRNKLVHSYTGNRKYAVTNDPTFNKPHDEIDGKLVVNTNYFIASIEKAFEIFQIELLDINSITRKNAIKWDNKYPLFRQIII